MNTSNNGYYCNTNSIISCFFDFFLASIDFILVFLAFQSKIRIKTQNPFHCELHKFVYANCYEILKRKCFGLKFLRCIQILNNVNG